MGPCYSTTRSEFEQNFQIWILKLSQIAYIGYDMDPNSFDLILLLDLEME